MSLVATVNRIAQSSSLTPNGKLLTTYIVSFSVGDHGPFQVQIDASGFSAAAVQAAMKPVVDEINALIPGS